MDVKQIILVAMLSCLFHEARGQEVVHYPIEDNLGKVQLNIETSMVNYVQKEVANYTKIGFGIGADIYLFNHKKSFVSLAPAILYNGADEERKTYSVENSNYFYRSTLLTGRLLFATALNYRRQITKQLALGVGFQPQFVLKSFRDQYKFGTSATSIPDIEFRKTESTILLSLMYQVDYNWKINLIGQFGVSPVTQDVLSPFTNALRFQLSRKIVN